jgi:hypothetical protein
LISQDDVMPTVEARFRRELIKYWRRPAVCRGIADLTGRYRDTARTLGLEGHINWVEAMP